MGNTNSGKSTFTNYQIGHKLEEAEDDYEIEEKPQERKVDKNNERGMFIPMNIFDLYE